jgi:hypothetical protein
VKRKEQIFQRRFLPALSRFSRAADLWTTEALNQNAVLPEQYSEVLNLIRAPRDSMHK